jgi:hypothetical protein
MRRFYLWGGILSTALFAIAVYYTLKVKWVSAADFDVTGILWLLQNLPGLAAVVVTFFMGVVAIFCFVAAARVRKSGLSDEGTEARFKERFGPQMK